MNTTDVSYLYIWMLNSIRTFLVINYVFYIKKDCIPGLMIDEEGVTVTLKINRHIRICLVLLTRY